MNRQQFWMGLVGLPAAGRTMDPAGTKPQQKSQDRDECKGIHSWTNGPFYLTAARTHKEPHTEPPSALVNVEHCTRCGVLRLMETWRRHTGESLGE